MLSKNTRRAMTTTLTLAVLMASAALTLAAEESTGTSASDIQGVGTLFLLIGLGAVGLVSLVSLSRERHAEKNDD